MKTPTDPPARVVYSRPLHLLHEPRLLTQVPVELSVALTASAQPPTEIIDSRARGGPSAGLRTMASSSSPLQPPDADVPLSVVARAFAQAATAFSKLGGALAAAADSLAASAAA